MVNGKPQNIRDYVFKNLAGLSRAQVLAKHASCSVAPKGFQLKAYWDSTKTFPHQFTSGTEGLKGTKEE